MTLASVFSGVTLEWHQYLAGVALVVENLPASARDVRDAGFNPWVGKIPWRRKWQPTPVFLPKNLLDRGTWLSAVHRITKSQTQWKRLSTHNSLVITFSDLSG